ncbi:MULTISPECIES: hypothetical protein [unclassified Streptomyces]|uniref:Uncharacterized protein n=1 Tax=Streptomyces sp. NBC_00060 TaxID=2975636 RepID=A0AAU2GT00_9ACTN
MGTANVVLQYVQAVIWPALIVAAVWIFRKQIGGLLTRLESFEGFGARMAFNQANKGRADLTRKVREEQETQLGGSDSGTSGRLPEEPHRGRKEEESPPDVLAQARELAATNPIAGMALAWSYVQTVAAEVLGEELPRLAGGEVWRPEAELVERGLTGLSAGLYTELRRMAHLARAKSDLSVSTVESYVESCATLVQEMRRLPQANESDRQPPQSLN